MGLNDELALSRLLGAIYTEVFQKKPANPNLPLNNAVHNIEEQYVNDFAKSVVIPNSVTYIWGPGGFSGEAPLPSVDISGRWGESGIWA